MFTHIFKYQLKYRLHDKIGIFATLIFPMILATFFNLAFSNLLSGEKFEKVNVALVNSSNISESFTTAIKDSELFVIESTDEDSAKEKLSKGEISGYFTSDNGEDIEITVSKSGINESIIKSFVDSYSERYATITNIITTNSSTAMSDDFINSATKYTSYTEDIKLNNSTNVMVIPFYTIIGMTCLLGSIWGSQDVMNIQADQSQRAARVNITPVNKLKIFLASLSATLLFYFLSILLVLLYISVVLKISFGDSIGYIILESFVGCFTGITFGTMLSAFIKKKSAVKEAIIISVTMLYSFLAGMMSVDVKYIIQEKFPLLGYLNPVNLITDGFYSLYYYDTLNRYFLNLGILGLMGVIFSIVTFVVLRRQKYASI